MLLRERWKPHPDFGGWYEISTLGRVRSTDRGIDISTSDTPSRRSGFILKPYINKQGYCTVSIRPPNGKVKTIKVHRLVLETFVGKSRMQADHINGIKKDNRLSNLEYVTAKENWIRKKAKKTDNRWVSYNKKYGYWSVSGMMDGKKCTFGNFIDRSDAIKARDIIWRVRPDLKKKEIK